MRKMTSPKMLLGSSWAHLKKHYKKLSLMTFLGLLPPLVFIPFFMSPRIAENIPLFLSIYFLYIIAAIVGSLVAGVGTLKLLEKPSMETREALRAGIQLLGPAFLVTLISFILTGIGFLLLVIPGIILSVFFAFGLFTLVLDGHKGWEALTKSKDLVTGYWWAVFGRFFLLGIVIIGLSMGAWLVMTVLMMGMMMINSILAMIAVLVVALAINILVQVYSYIFMYQMYGSLKELYIKNTSNQS